MTKPVPPTDKTLDCKGLACPMPIVRTKKALEQLKAGQIIEVQATDIGSLADIRGWAKSTGHQYLGTISEGDVLRHYVRKASPGETKEPLRFPFTLTNEEVQSMLERGEPVVIVDVREAAEYAFQRIPGAVSVPLGELESRMSEWSLSQPLLLVCRTGTRSDIACRMLAEKGFDSVKNIVPGMSAWSGPVESSV